MFRLIILRILENYFLRPLFNLIPLAIMLTLGLLLQALSKPIYIAHGGLAVQRTNVTENTLGLADRDYVWKTPAETTVEGIEELFTSDSIIRAIIASTDLETYLSDPEIDQDLVYEMVRADVWVEALGDEHFTILAKSEEPLVAQQLVQATINTFLQWNSNIGITDSKASVEFFSDQLVKDEAEFDQAQLALREYLINYPEPIRGERTEIERLELNRLNAVANQAAARYSATRGKLDFATLAAKLAETEVSQRYLIIDEPSLPDEAESSFMQTVMSLIVFGLIGLALSFVLVLVKTAFDRTFRYPVDVRLGLQAVTLGGVPIASNMPMAAESHRARRRRNKKPVPIYSNPISAQPMGMVPNVDPPTMIIYDAEKALIQELANSRYNFGTVIDHEVIG